MATRQPPPTDQDQDDDELLREYLRDRARPARTQPRREKPVEPKSSGGAENIAVAAALFFFGALAWVIGGKFTIEGWADWLNHIGAWLGVRETFAAPTGWALIGLTVPVGLVYSFVELRVRSSAARRSPLFWLAWIPIILSDVGSTFVGVQATPDTAPLVIRQIAAAWVLSAVAAAVLTFVPEYMIIGAWKLVRRLL